MLAECDEVVVTTSLKRGRAHMCGNFSTLFERRCCTKVPKVGFSWGRGNKICRSPAYSIAQGGKFVVCWQLWGFVSFWIVWRLTCTRFYLLETTIAEKINKCIVLTWICNYYPITTKFQNLLFLTIDYGNYLDPTLNTASSAWKDISAAILKQRATTTQKLC